MPGLARLREQGGVFFPLHAKEIQLGQAAAMIGVGVPFDQRPASEDRGQIPLRQSPLVDAEIPIAHVARFAGQRQHRAFQSGAGETGRDAPLRAANPPAGLSSGPEDNRRSSARPPANASSWK